VAEPSRVSERSRRPTSAEAPGLEPGLIPRWVALWHERVGKVQRRVSLSLVFAAWVAAAHLGRLGTPAARLAAASLVVFAAALGIGLVLRERRALATPRAALRRIVVPVDAELGEKALRAEALVTRATSDRSAGSLELARSHFARVLSKVSLERLAEAARVRGRRLGLVALALVVAGAAAIAVGPMRVIEGLDVLFARRGVAPIPLSWLDTVSVTVQPPSYLRAAERAILPWGVAELPEGSQLVVRGVPLRPGRRLVLADGKTEVEFVDDGADGVVARWTLAADNTNLRVAARFGGVLVPDPENLEIIALRDRVPEVVLEGAPRSLALKELERLEFRYLVGDDHGLEQIDLVLRSGAREERRVLMRLDGESKLERGAHALDVRDAFLRRMFLPVIASIEARDNEKAKGERWGKSQAITVVPPAIGEPEALRYAALEAARARVVELFDHQLESERLKKSKLSASESKARASAERELEKTVLRELGAVTSNAYAGARVGSGLSAFILGQARSFESKARSRRRTEDVLLALDAALRGLAERDAAEVAKRLADAADEVAEGAKLALRTEKKNRGLERLSLALGVLDTGAGHLRRLGVLGADLGSVTAAEIRRIRRAESASALGQVELAARHLAARLRRPAPSFSSSGGSVESGRGAEGPGRTSEADRQFDQLMEELEQLAAQHAEEIRRVERAMSDADQATSAEELAAEARARAERLRQKFDDLPLTGAEQGSARAAAALAREHMSAMAQNLERLALADAVNNGGSAKDMLDQASRLAEDMSRAANWLDREQLGAAKGELEGTLAWAEQALDRLREKAAQNAARDLSEAGEREERLAERASNLAGRGAHSEARLPEDVEEALERAESVMRDAARELSAGRGEAGLELEREAQRLLERSSSGRTTDESEPEASPQQGREGSDGREMARSGEVPAAEQAERAADFRRRVLDGLSKERRGRLSPAVERYAEGLLE
jgi:hypothetical protein